MTDKQVILEHNTLREGLMTLRDLLEVQTDDGNWNYNSYMHGMANGMILSENVVSGEDKDPIFLDTPEEWLSKPSQQSLEDAFATLTNYLKKDKGLAHGWHCNLAMAFFDSTPSTLHAGDDLMVANEGATRFMKNCFNVDTSQNMLNETEVTGELSK